MRILLLNYFVTILRFFLSTVTCVNPLYYFWDCHVLRGSITLIYFIYLPRGSHILWIFFLPSFVLPFWWNTKMERKIMVSKLDDGKFIPSNFYKVLSFIKKGEIVASLNSLFIYQYVLMKDKKELVIYIFIMLILINYYMLA